MDLHNIIDRSHNALVQSSSYTMKAGVMLTKAIVQVCIYMLPLYML